MEIGAGEKIGWATTYYTFIACVLIHCSGVDLTWYTFMSFLLFNPSRSAAVLHVGGGNGFGAGGQNFVSRPVPLRGLQPSLPAHRRGHAHRRARLSRYTYCWLAHYLYRYLLDSCHWLPTNKYIGLRNIVHPPHTAYTIPYTILCRLLYIV
jgi:hypothetical protein